MAAVRMLTVTAPAMVCTVLRRQLGTTDAIVLGLGAMLGAGVFTAFSPAARAAGEWLLLALVLAAIVATCNALSSADLAARYPESGGSYVYAQRLLGRWPARVAGVAFLASKTSSAAAAAGTLGVYVAGEHPLPVALAVIAVMTTVNTAGIRATATVTRALVAIVLVTLAIVVAAGLASDATWATPALPTSPASPAVTWAALVPYDATWAAHVSSGAGVVGAGTPLGVLTAAGLLFFAFAGYARMATLGEEVREPDRTLRRAIPLALGVTLLAYFAVAIALLLALGAARLGAEPAPLVAVVVASPLDGLTVFVRIGAVVALVSVLLSVLVGVSRTTLAMARTGDLPGALAHVGRRDTPWRADLAGGAVAALIAVFAGPAAAVALSACSVLVYYAITNAAALRLTGEQRRWPRWTAYAGLALCCLLAVTLPRTQVLNTAAVLVVGVGVTALVSRYRPGP
jgi:basic amino acid/polyamine antiporter, APA family